MDNRLTKIASFIEDGIGFADIGTDHGFLPCELARSGYSGNIIASDINSLPLQTAIDLAEAQGLLERIDFQLCDGLSFFGRDKVDTIIVAGMGGDTICKILDEGYWCLDPKYKLILQPMSKAEVVRYWLVYNGFEILSEALAEDSGTLYQIICARYGGITRLSDAELFVGKYMLAEDKALFLRRLRQLCAVFYKALAGLEQAEDKAKRLRYALYCDIYAQLIEMRELYGEAQ